MEENETKQPGSTNSVLPIVRIDGSQIKKIRDAKGLTQLYLSEVVGVTTDTISRWENRRYPSIKLENAQKLAQALEVELDEILEKEGKTQSEETQQSQVQERKRFTTKPYLKIILPSLLAIIVLGAYLFTSLHKTLQPPVSATRILPQHIPPGQIFPVLIRVENPADASISLILKESVPPGTSVESGMPPFTAFDKRKNEIKWISRTDNNQIIYAYSVRSPDTFQEDKLEFTGTFTLKQTSGHDNSIHGSKYISAAPFHWADTNKDLVIDDEEILAVYDLYSEIPGLNFDRDLIDDIWAGTEYQWDKKTGKYIVIE